MEPGRLGERSHLKSEGSCAMKKQELKKYWEVRTKTQLSFMIVYTMAPNLFTQHSRPSTSWCQPISQVLLPSTLPCVFWLAMTLRAVSQKCGTQSCVGAPNMFPILPPLHILGKAFLGFGLFNATLYSWKFCKLLSPAFIHQSQQAIIIAFSLSFSCSSSSHWHLLEVKKHILSISEHQAHSQHSMHFYW